MRNFKIFFSGMLLLFGCLSMHADDWMSRLPDEAYIATVSIPGAHDAATGSGWEEGSEAWGDLYARTQDLTLDEMWSAGVRAFDFRPCVYEDYMNLNHGIMPTQVHFENALRLLRDSLVAHPSEFIIIHLLHETDGDLVQDVYNQRIMALLTQDELKDYFVSFKRDLKVSELRGKMLVLSRDKYSDNPVGGYFTGWTGENNWAKQMAAHIMGKKGTASAQLTVQDYSDTHQTGGIAIKVSAIRKLLDYSTKMDYTKSSGWRWIFNFASAYSLVESLFGFELSLSDGYRDNAVNTHAAILDYLATETYVPGPLGVVMMDFVGVDQSGNYAVRGKELVNAIINNNFRYLSTEPNAIQPAIADWTASQAFTADGKRVGKGARSGLRFVRQADGKVRKYMSKENKGLNATR
jgi:hypothetical protein